MDIHPINHLLYYSFSSAHLNTHRMLRHWARSMTTKAIQPLWHKPTPVTPEPVLRVYNSLTRTKDEFVPLHGRRVDWYNCGPTVYDAAHMGHARNYLTQDIIRRVLRDYFAYDVNFVQNVTDLDDKVSWTWFLSQDHAGIV